MLSPPTLTCSCKAARCAFADCMKCSKCGCDHNGESVTQKILRKRGRPKRLDDSIAFKEPTTATPLKSVRAPYSDTRARLPPGSYAPPLTPQEAIPKTIKDVMTFFGETNDSYSYIRKNIGSKSVRYAAETWTSDGTDDGKEKNRATVLNLYSKLLKAIAVIVCGPDAAMASIHAFELKCGALSFKKSRTSRASLASERTMDVAALATAVSVTPKGSIERWTLRAIAAKSFSHTQWSCIASRFPGSYFSRHSHSVGLADYAKLLVHGKLTKQTWSRQRYDPSVIQSAIQFVLSGENVAYLSWGTKRIMLDGVNYDVPAILKKRDVQTMFNQYIMTKRNGEDCVSRRTFYRIANVLTHGDVEARTSVDYVSGILLNDNFSTLSRICKDFLGNKADILSDLQTLKSWLKYGSFWDISSSTQQQNETSFAPMAECPRHDFDFGLSQPKCPSPKARMLCCGPCTGMRGILAAFVEQLTIAGAGENALQVVHDGIEKLELFAGHRLRVVNQQRAINSILEELCARATENGQHDEALVVIDFKMKAEPIYYREKTLDHYGKRGMSWHGAMVRFWNIGDGEEAPSEEKIYYNHISGADNKQDKEAVVSLIEAVIIAIKRDLPHVHKLTFQSDNASSYQNSFVAIILPVLGYAHGLTVTRFIHTETQDGKSLLDAQFARAAKKVRRWVHQGMDVATPTQLVAALVADGGMPNALSELVEYNRSATTNLEAKLGSAAKKFSAIMGRKNDIIYDVTTTAAVTSIEGQHFNLSSMPPIRVRAFEHSGVGGGTEVEIDIGKGSCILQNENRGAGVSLTNSTNDDNNDECHNIEEFDPDAGNCYESSMERDLTYNETEDLQFDEESYDDDEDDDEDEGEELVSEIIFPQNANGCVTGVRVTTEAQIRRRAQKWRCTSKRLLVVSAERLKKGTKEVNVSAFAKRCLINLKLEGSLSIVEAPDLPSKMVSAAHRHSKSLVQLQSLTLGWARRPPKGKMYGAKYIQAYTKDVEELFQRGAENNGDKIGPARMVEQLVKRYPGRYDIPSETEIKRAISTLFSQQRQAGLDSDRSLPPRKKRRVMDNLYVRFLESVVRQNPSVKPKLAVNLFRAEFPSASNVADSQIKNKLSSIKRIEKSSVS